MPGNVPLDVLLAGNDYVSRVRALVEPVWRQRLAKKVQYYRQIGRDLPKCHTTLLVQTNAVGSNMTLSVLHSCSDSSFDKEALEAFRYLGQLPPPPKNLIVNNLLALWWQFELK